MEDIKTRRSPVFCPYCDFENNVAVNPTCRERKEVITCDSERGGCDRDFVAVSTVTVSTVAFALVGIAPEVIPDAAPKTGVSGGSNPAAIAAAAGLKIWNGRADGRDFATFFVCAKSAAEAVRLLIQAGHSNMTKHELATYFHAGAWGNSMVGIHPERGVWATRKGEGSTETAPERLV